MQQQFFLESIIRNLTACYRFQSAVTFLMKYNVDNIFTFKYQISQYYCGPKGSPSISREETQILYGLRQARFIVLNGK